ncbi:hypothetical protein N7494_006937 [Penicillium frequentans]|uniref:Uncharacterized protein n=1 Tax=Penicillium frequentans TaxID=3151616 RepID=A0AAD6GH32_9EURO|nr:hypothetical protein N7494_006937 [Penicillium glabrum]
MIALQTHYLYYHLVFAIERVSLHIDPNRELQGKDNKWNLMSAARKVIEIVQFIDVEPHMPVFVVGIMPLSAIFILFDFAIHNPGHKQTECNLALLDQASEYFGQVDFASGGALPGNIISSFAGIARQYTLNLQGSGPISGPEMHQGIQPIWDYAPNIDFRDIDVVFFNIPTYEFR